MKTRFAPTGLVLSAALATLALAPASTAAPDELLQLLPADGHPGQRFGYSVALDGQIVVVGAPNASVGPPASLSSTYLFDVVTGQQLHKLVPPDGPLLQAFGFSVSISGDRAAVGAHFDDDLGDGSGSVSVFDVNTGQHLYKLLAADGAADDEFGFSVSIEGDRVLVGAPYRNEGAGREGAAYVFDAATGVQLQKLLSNDLAFYDLFGYSVSIHGDRALVGAINDDDYGPASGSAYLFDANTGQQLFKLSPTDGIHLGVFGRAVALNESYAVVGTPQDDDNGQFSGSVYVFDASTGQRLLKLHPSDADELQFFGSSVSIDGDRILVGAQGHSAAYLFDAVTGQEHEKLVSSTGTLGDYFGSTASIDGSFLVLGAWNDDFAGSNTGAAYVFDSGVEPGIGYCSGDSGVGTPCPCGNDNDGSVPGSGCANGVFTSGAQLSGSGQASVSDDTLVLVTTGLEPNNSGLYFQANNDLSPGNVWGDGLRCAGGTLMRLGVRFSDGTGYSDTSGFSTAISVKAGNVQPGDTKYYQCWYRSIVNSPCSNDFNASNGYAIVWYP